MKKMKDQVYIRFTNQNPVGHNSKDSMTGKRANGVYAYRMDLDNPHMSDREIMEVANIFCKSQMGDVHTWGYARLSDGEFCVFDGKNSQTGRDGIIIEPTQVIGWGQIEIK